MTDRTLPLTWQLQCLPNVGADDGAVSAPQWLAELSEMRGRILFAEGRRPAFRLEDGSFADPDPLDAYAYHILARTPFGLAGCCRILSFATAPTSVTESILGPQFGQLLLKLGTTRAESCEGSRWLVAREYRAKATALRLVAGAWAVARWLGFKYIIGMVGTKDKQDCVLRRTGGRPVPGLATHTCKTFADELRALYFDVLHPAQPFSSLVDEMEALLGLKHRTDQLRAGGIADAA